MKKKTTLRIMFMLLCFSMFSHAQSQNLETQDLKNLSVSDRSFIMGEGFPVSSYKFDNQQINKHLQLGLQSRKIGKTLSIAGYMGMGVGILGMFTGSDASVPLAVVGGLGGGTTAIIGMTKRMKSRKDIKNATLLYNEMKSK